MRQFWTVDINFTHPDGRRERVRKVSPVESKRGAEQYERQLRQALLDGTYGREEAAPAPTLSEFEAEFIEKYCEANKQKPSGIESKVSVLKNHLVPLFGGRRLDTLGPADEDRLKAHFKGGSPSTYNNSASVMNVVLKAAHRWGKVSHVPHRFQLLKRDKSRPRFYDFDQFEWLVEAAGKCDARIELLVLLGGEAGLRRGEVIALEWSDVDLRRELITVERSEWKGKVTATKGMKYRVVPMTKRLHQALAAHRHLRGPRVLYTDAGETVTAKVLQKWMAQAQKRAGLRHTGALHILRHTFCSHLAMRGATAISIQQLAGHDDINTTLGYMHLAKGETERAIRLLDDRSAALANGNMAATEGDVLVK
ncbi:MAG: tyrosine-type recombinase/integrase [Polyangiaceae bacterium]|nr:tyrosine-type recombinase/integrase [Polyangiaceae bacterium]